MMPFNLQLNPLVKIIPHTGRLGRLHKINILQTNFHHVKKKGKKRNNKTRYEEKETLKEKKSKEKRNRYIGG